MKISEIQKGMIVYFKISENDGSKNPEQSRVVLDIIQDKYHGKKVLLEGISKPVSSGELTDTKCSDMTCARCKYHPALDKQ